MAPLEGHLVKIYLSNCFKTASESKTTCTLRLKKKRRFTLAWNCVKWLYPNVKTFSCNLNSGHCYEAVVLPFPNTL